MSKYSDLAKKNLGMRKVKIDDLVRDFDGVVTINGFHGYTEYDGKSIPVFGIAEGGGMTFWGGCKRMLLYAEELIATGDSVAVIDAGLQAAPFRVKFYPIITVHGKKFRPVDFLGEVAADKFVSKNGVLDDVEDYDPDTGEIITAKKNHDESDPF